MLCILVLYYQSTKQVGAGVEVGGSLHKRIMGKVCQIICVFNFFFFMKWDSSRVPVTVSG